MYRHLHIHVHLHTYKHMFPTSHTHSRETTIYEPMSLLRDKKRDVR